MITTRRQSSGTNEILSRGSDLLEREEPIAFNEYVTNKNLETPVENGNQEKRMSKNFDLLLNYEKYLEEAKKSETYSEEKAEVASTVETKIVDEVEAPSKTDENIMPSSTTMQFGEGNDKNLLNDIRKENKSAVKQDARYHLSAQGKVLFAIYAIVVAVIMALIIINTTVLANIKATSTAKMKDLSRLQATYGELQQKYNEISSDKHVIEIAEGEYNMIK